MANIALDGLEEALAARFSQTAKSINRLRVRLVRYADDFIITGNSKELLEQKVKPCVEAFLAERGLELSQEKTRITHISEGFDFLGQNVRKYDGKLLIKPSVRNVKAFLDNVRDAIRGEPLDETGSPDRFAQPQDQGLGKLPSARCRKEDIRSGGCPHLASALALGAA